MVRCGCSRDAAGTHVASRATAATTGATIPCHCGILALFLLAPSSNPYVSGGRKRVKRRTTTNGVASSSPFTNLSTVSVSAPNLGVQEEGYTIVPLSYDAGSEAEWTISVFCERSFGLSALP